MRITQTWLQDWLKKHHPGLQLIAFSPNFFTIREPYFDGTGKWTMTLRLDYINQDQLATLLLAFP